MKKNVLLMAGMLTIALAGSAQAAGNTLFAVQGAKSVADPTVVDKITMSDTGDVLAAGKLGIGLLQNPVGPTPLTGPLGSFHSASKGIDIAAPSFYAQHVATCSAANCTTFQPALAPNFSFYRINQKDDSSYVMPQAGDLLGYFNFGTLIPLQSQDLAGRKNAGGFFVRAESDWSGPPATGVPNVTPIYFLWSSTAVGGGLVEKMRLSSKGELGIGLSNVNPTSKLQVVGLINFASNDAARQSGLTPGAFYLCGGTKLVAPQNLPTPGTDTVSQTLCVVY
jgi:hypothetical protein